MWFIGVEVEQETSAPPPKKILDPPLQSTLILVPYHIMIATSYVILLSVLHILDFQLDAEKIKTVLLDNHYTSL